MCMFTPSAPSVPTPERPQEVKQPETQVLRDAGRRNRASAAGGMGSSLITGPMGVTSAPTAKSSLLGQ